MRLSLLLLLSTLAACEPRATTSRQPTAPPPPQAAPLSSPPSPAPLPAEAEAFVGPFAGERFVLRLDLRGDDLVGTISIGERGPFPASASVADETLTGHFQANGEEFPFSARRDGRGLVLTADGRDFHLTPTSDLDRASPPAALTGTYSGRLNGLSATLTLKETARGLEGEAVTSDGYRYTLSAQADGASGSFVDAQSGHALPAQLAPSADGVSLTLSAPGKQPATVPFTRGPAPISGGSSRDPSLFGTWIQGASDDSAPRPTLRLNADGTYLYGTSRPTRGGAGLSGQAGEGQVIQGVWRTEAGALFTRPSGLNAWARYARYSLEGDELRLTFEDARVEAWVRGG